MKKTLFFICIVFCFLTLKAQNKKDTVYYEFKSLYSGGDTGYFKTYFLNDSLQVRQFFFGHSFDKSSIIGEDVDTFVVYKNEWKKIFKGIIYPFLSVSDFVKHKSTIEYLKNEGPWKYRYRYTPVTKLKIDNELIFVYDRDVIDSTGRIKTNDTRIYFSFQHGLIGYLNLNENMVMKSFLKKLKMQLRKRITV
jgi:hypothetical protein